MFIKQCKELRTTHLTPLLVMTVSYTCWLLWWGDCIEDFKWRLIFDLELRFERLFWESYILKDQITFEGHWRLSILNTARGGRFYVPYFVPGIVHSKDALYDMFLLGTVELARWKVVGNAWEIGRDKVWMGFAEAGVHMLHWPLDITTREPTCVPHILN